MTKEKRELRAEQAAAVVQDIITKKLEEEPDFSGKISLELNCIDGGIGTIDAFVKRKIK